MKQTVNKKNNIKMNKLWISLGVASMLAELALVHMLILSGIPDALIKEILNGDIRASMILMIPIIYVFFRCATVLVNMGIGVGAYRSTNTWRTLIVFVELVGLIQDPIFILPLILSIVVYYKEKNTVVGDTNE